MTGAEIKYKLCKMLHKHAVKHAAFSKEVFNLTEQDRRAMHYDLSIARKKPQHREMSRFAPGQIGDRGHSWELSKSLSICSLVSLT